MMIKWIKKLMIWFVPIFDEYEFNFCFNDQNLLFQGLEYGRYLQEVVKALDDDPVFSKKLGNVTHEQIMVYIVI